MDQERKYSKGGRICPQCGAGFICGLLADDSSTDDIHCWCFDLPPVLPVRADTACLCPACVMDAIRQQAQVSPQEKT